jgi:hypothetical protein
MKKGRCRLWSTLLGSFSVTGGFVVTGESQHLREISHISTSIDQIHASSLLSDSQASQCSCRLVLAFCIKDRPSLHASSVHSAA